MQVLTAVTERLMDVDEKVRSSAIAAICDAAVKNLQVWLQAIKSCWSYAVAVNHRPAPVHLKY